MSIRNNIAFAALVLCAVGSNAQSDTTGARSADAYFNRASRQYVKEDKSSAMRVLDEGLRAHPGDAKLLKLAEQLLKEEQQQNKAQQPQQQEQEQQQEQGQEQQQEKEQVQQQDKEQERNSGGMEKRDAERMLDELNRKEQDVQERVRARSMPGRKARIEKDW
ncbi:MAG: hypothetical protein IPK70_12275 [Flavobacteriales bacterium]|jgi:Ca-activated chloride channel family protein|nr:hypothetical protein [Flavobacteriales bacterium]